MKKCKSCFRFAENWRDAEEKGIAPVRYAVFREYYRLPREGIRTRCLMNDFKKEIPSNQKACKYHDYRWKMNIKKWYQWRFKAWYRDNVKVRIGGLRKPMHTKEGDCPYCNEILYNPKRCLFCGQRGIE
ncbi:MAG: hypothetical protein ACOCG5_09460 [Candidatus Alkaliphilus sp. MAG34]